MTQQHLEFDRGKFLIIHADDLGMCHSVNRAIIAAFEAQTISSASVMVPCPWFSEAAAYLSRRENVDVGVHLTLTSEWKDYRWHPMSFPSQASGLVDGTGRFWPSTSQITADRPAVIEELCAQIVTAREACIDISHVDSHMFAAFASKDLFISYISAARRFRVPFLYHTGLYRPSGTDDAVRQEDAAPMRRIYQVGPKISPLDWEDFYVNLLNFLPPGVSQLTVHPGFDDSELRAITSGVLEWGASWRERDLRVLESSRFRHALASNNIRIISWRDLLLSNTASASN